MGPHPLMYPFIDYYCLFIAFFAGFFSSIFMGIIFFINRSHRVLPLASSFSRLTHAFLCLLAR